MSHERAILPPPNVGSPSLAMLAEGPEPLALCLWQYARHLRDYAGASSETRGALFHSDPAPWVYAKREEGRANAAEMADHLATIEALLTHPTGEPSAAADAAEALARWAEAQAWPHTAAELAETAAVLARDSPRHANLAGRLTRNAGNHARAEAWLDRGIVLARRNRDWVEFTRGHLGAGILCMNLGHDARARRHLNTASSIAMRQGQEWLAGEAQHDLFSFMLVRGHLNEAEAHARRALRWYPKHHPRVPYLAADFAFLLLSRGLYDGAATVLTSFLQTVQPPQSLLGYGVLARALAGAGRMAEFTSVREDLLRLLGRYPSREAGARWHLAHAERLAGRWDDALTSAAGALDAAIRSGDAETERLSRELYSALETHVLPAPSPSEPPTASAELIAKLVKRLSVWSPIRSGRRRTMRDWAA